MSGRKATPPVGNVSPDISDRPAAGPKAPKFRMSEGTREELERTGKATCPFTGRALTKDDL